MGLFKKKKKTKAKKIKTKESYKKYVKWIYVSLVTYFEGPKKEIEKNALDIANIINNTHVLTNSEGAVFGYVNPYLGLNIASASKVEDGKVKNIIVAASMGEHGITLNITRKFFPLIEKMNKRWKITFVPEKVNKKDETNLYSLPNLANDFWILCSATNLIRERYNIVIKDERPTFTPKVEEGVPIIELYDQLLVIKYSMENRIFFSKENIEADKLVLGQNSQDVHQLIDFISESQPDSEWVKSVKEICKNNP